MGKVKAIQPFHLVRMAVNVNGTALATYETQATVARSGKQLTIRAGCNYSNGRWLISGLNFNGPDVLAPVAPAKH